MSLKILDIIASLFSRFSRQNNQPAISPVQPGYVGGMRSTPSPVPTVTPTAKPTPTPTPIPEVAEALAAGRNTPIIQSILARFPKEEGHNPVNIAFRESSFNPGAVGAAGEKGLFQILPSTFYGEKPNMPEELQGYTFEDMSNINPAIEVARWLFDRYGWNPWSTAGPLGLKGKGKKKKK